MQRLQTVFTQGLQRALRLRLLLPLYLTGLLLGLVQTWPLLYAAADGMLNNPVMEDLAGGGSDALLNLMLDGSYDVAMAVTGWLFTTLLLTLVFSLAYNFFSGGILSVWTDMRSFWAGCRRNLLSFTGLGLILVLLAALTLVGVALLGGLLGGTASLIIALLLLQVINLVGEYARAIGVVHDRRNPLVMFGMAVRFCLRHVGGVLAPALLGLLLHGGLLLLYRGVLSGVDNLVVTIIGQQLLVLAWLWIKLLRLGWATSYAQSFVSQADAERQTPPPPVALAEESPVV
jgi:hypothetical protein